jgi:hypothetical protein
VPKAEREAIEDEIRQAVEPAFGVKDDIGAVAISSSDEKATAPI